MNKLKTTTGERIRLARENAGLSKSALSRLVGVSHTAVGLWENNDTKDILAKHILKIAKATNTAPEFLVDGKEKEQLEKQIREPSPEYSTTTPTKEEQTFLDKFRALPPEDKERIRIAVEVFGAELGE